MVADRSLTSSNESAADLAKIPSPQIPPEKVISRRKHSSSALNILQEVFHLVQISRMVFNFPLISVSVKAYIYNVID